MVREATQCNRDQEKPPSRAPVQFYMVWLSSSFQMESEKIYENEHEAHNIFDQTPGVADKTCFANHTDFPYAYV